MRRFVTRHAIGFGLAGAIALGAATPLAAAPMMSNATALNAAVPTNTDQIRWRGHRHGGWWPGAVVGGLAAGAIIGSQIANPYYYGNPYYGSYAYDPYPYQSYGYVGPYYRGGRGFYDPDCIGEYDSAGVRRFC